LFCLKTFAYEATEASIQKLVSRNILGFTITENLKERVENELRVFNISTYLAFLWLGRSTPHSYKKLINLNPEYVD
jgi:hypothetical protein